MALERRRRNQVPHSWRKIAISLIERPNTSVLSSAPMYRWNSVALFILLSQLCCAAQGNGCTERTLIVTARDADHRKALLSTLQTFDLRGKINGKPMQILASRKPATPTRVVLVLDASGSMSSKWETALEFAARVVKESGEYTQFAIVAFADKELKKVEFNKTGPDFINEVMTFQSVKPYGRTALRNAIWEAATMLRSGAEGDAIVVVSDGIADHSTVPLRRIQEAIWELGIRVMFVQLVDHYLASQSQGGDDMDAYWLSQSSGGFLFRAENPQVLPNIAHVIALEIENYLSVRIKLPTPLEKDASVHFEAVDASGHKPKNIELGFPEKLLPCTTAISAP